MNRNLSRGMETIFFNKILKLKVKYWNKKSLNGIKIREKTAKQRSVNLKIHEYKVIQSGVQGKKKIKEKNRTSRVLWDNIKWFSIWVSGYQKEKKKWTIFFKK